MSWVPKFDDELVRLYRGLNRGVIKYVIRKQSDNHDIYGDDLYEPFPDFWSASSEHWDLENQYERWSAISTVRAEKGADDALHLFMADCDRPSLIQSSMTRIMKPGILAFRGMDPSLRIIESSQGRYHLVGGMMSWKEMTARWKDLKKLRAIDDAWVERQHARGFASLRMCSADDHEGSRSTTPHIVCDVGTLNNLSNDLVRCILGE